MRNDWYIDWIGGFSSTITAGSAVTEERRGIVGDVDSPGAQRDFSYVRKDCSQEGSARHCPKDHGRSGRGMVTATVPNDLTTDKEKETQS